MADRQLSARYLALKGTKWFVIIIMIVIAVWMVTHFVFGMDADLGGLNTFLSSEASISQAFQAMGTETSLGLILTVIKMLERMEVMQGYILDVTKATHALLVHAQSRFTCVSCAPPSSSASSAS